MPIQKDKYKGIRTLITPRKHEHLLIGIRKRGKGKRGGTTELIEIRR